MQQEAVRRVREMQARAQHLRPEPAQRREPPEPEPSHQHGERSHERREQPSMPPVPLGPPKPPAEGIFKSLMRDSDQTLILILLLLLMENEADMELIFALMYLRFKKVQSRKAASEPFCYSFSELDIPAILKKCGA